MLLGQTILKIIILSIVMGCVKRCSVFIAMILILMTFVVVQDVSATEHLEEDGPTITGTFENFSETLREEGYEFESSFEGEIKIHDSLELPARILLGIPRGETVHIEILIVLVSLWIAMFMLILGVLQLTPFMKEGYVRFLGALIVTSLISMTGVLLLLVNYLFSLLEFLNWIEKLGAWQIVLGIIVGTLIILGGIKIMKFLGLKIGDEQNASLVRNMKLLGTHAREISKE